MNRTLVFICLTLIYNHVYSQNEKNIWFFGDNAGLDFNSGTPIPITGALITDEGCSSIADSNGELLFYTDGVTVWNKNHQIMNNGTSLSGHESTTQSATIVKKPGDESIYYIFTLDAELGSNGFRYSLVDISLNSGLGSVIEKNIHIRNSVCEKIAIIKHVNNFDFWVIVHGFNGFFYSYLVTSNGISPAPIESNVGYNLPLVYAYAKGMMKASPNGNKIAVTNSIHYQSVEVFDFNNTSGELSNGIALFDGHSFSYCNGGGYYGIEFSPNGNLLYVSNVTCSDIYQFDLTATDISASSIQITLPNWSNSIGSLQLAPNNKIYVSIYEKNYLAVINYPNNIGLACDYQEQGINLLQGTNARLGLPISYTISNLDILFNLQPNCDNMGVLFSIDSPLLIENVSWSFGDGNTSNQFSPSHEYYNSGSYTITLIAETNMGTITTNKTIYINVNNTTELPIVNLPDFFCQSSYPTIENIEVIGQNIKWYDEEIGGNELPTTTILVDNQTYYVSQTIDECESFRIPVLIDIYSPTIPQAETNQVLCIDSNPTLNDVSIDGENIKWYDENGNVLLQNTSITENRIVYATQTIDDCESQQISINITLQHSLNTNDYTFYLCDENSDNSETVNLSDYNQYFINNGTIQNFTFTYYNSYQNALNEINSISDFSNYQSSTEIVYVRISSNTTVCFDISELSINLIGLPEIPLTENIYYLCGDSPLQLQLPDNGNIDYIWFNGSTSVNITISAEGEYWVKTTKTENGISCESTHHFSVKRTEPIHIAEIKIDDWTENNNTITVLPYNENYVYSLDGFLFQNENYFENLPIGKYTIYVKDRGDCDEFSDVVYLLNYPKFFTPNGDGINDYWRVKFSQFQEAFDVEIYDRYGKLITVFDKNSTGWDGKLNGENLPATDYWFKITRISDQKIIYRGHFSLVR